MYEFQFSRFTLQSVIESILYNRFEGHHTSATKNAAPDCNLKWQKWNSNVNLILLDYLGLHNVKTSGIFVLGFITVEAARKGCSFLHLLWCI